MRRLAFTAGLGLLVAAACARNPATGKNELMLVSEGQEIQMGAQYDSQVVAEIGLYPDPALQSYVADLGKKLAATSERPSLPWTFRVVDDPSVNAFAIPGGHVYVTRGLLTHITSEAELATVMGHEIGHVTARHTAHEMSKQELAQLGLAIGSIASSQVANYAGLASQALQVLFLKFSRDNENQADALGVRYSSRANFDSRQMINVMQMLDNLQSQSGGRLPEWLATHPNPGNRIEHINSVLGQTKVDFSNATVNAQDYERRLDGMIFGMNPREGFFKGTQFYHPDLKFQMSFPSGWQTANSKQSVAAQSPQQDAVIELTLAQGSSNADQAARSFLSQQGVQAGQLTHGNVNGLSASTAPFAATTQNGTLRGQALFVQYNNNVYRLLGYGPEQTWSNNQGVVQRALSSFGPLNDASILNVQPQHLSLFTLDRRATIADLARQRPSPVSVATLALINQVNPNDTLEPGRIVKWVVGQQLPVTP
ncbi:MAG TPA: M48 family metalloprotease [Gemmatimonadales bacterium]|nr:M48 family metalloprotease [Gemmatimonadales bacterium]